MSIYIEAERKLAELKGWTDIQLGGVDGDFNIPPKWLTGKLAGDRELIPMWARQKAPAFDLMVEMDCYPTTDGSYACVTLNHEPEETGIVLYLTDHPDKATAVRFAIVQAAIAKIEASKP